MKKGVDHRVIHLVLVGLILLGFVIFSFANIAINNKISGEPVREVNVQEALEITNTEIPKNHFKLTELSSFYSNKISEDHYSKLFGKNIEFSYLNKFYRKKDLSYYGYIVELKDNPVSAYFINQKGSNSIASTSKQSVSNYKNIIQSKQDVVKLNIESITEKAKIVSSYQNAFNGFSILDISEAEVKQIESLPEVKKIYPNYKVHTTLMDSIHLINADDVWDMQIDGINLTGKGVTIGIIDTGVDYTHPDLGGCFGSGCKVIGGYDFSDNDLDPMDYEGHGTHVAATVAGNGILKGVAPDATIHALKVFPNSYSSTIISAIEYALDPDNDGDFSDHLDIISLSLGGYGNPDDPMSQAIDNAANVGVVSVIAAGNDGPHEKTISSPGTAREAITVGATYKKNYQDFYASADWCSYPDSSHPYCTCVNSTTALCNYFGDSNPNVDQVISFSSRGPVLWENGGIGKPDIVAPGAFICAARFDSILPIGDNIYYYPCLDNKHVQLAGTSMATPIVSGVVALIKQAHPDWTPEEIKLALRNTAVDLGEEPFIQGYGRIDVKSAVLSERPLISKIDSSGLFLGNLDIVGTAKGNGFNHYGLSYKKRENSNWNLICEGNTEVDNSILCSNFNAMTLSDGEYDLRLVVYSQNSSSSEDQTIFVIDNIQWESGGIEIMNYGYYEIVSKYYSIEDYIKDAFYQGEDFYEIVGTLASNSIENFSFTYAKEDTPEIRLNQGVTLNSNLPILNSTIATLNPNYLDNGNYYLYLTIYFSDGEIHKETRTLTVEKRLNSGWKNLSNYQGTYVKSDDVSSQQGKEVFYGVINGEIDSKSSKGDIYGNWPIKTEYTTVLHPSIGDVDGDGDKEIFIAGGRGFRNSTKIYAFDGNGNNLNSTWPKDNLDFTTYQIMLENLDNDSDLEIVVPSILDNFTSYLFGSYPYDIKIDVFNQNAESINGNWPAYFTNIGYFNSAVTGDITGDGISEIIFSVIRGGCWDDWDWENSGITIRILNNQANLILTKEIPAELINPDPNDCNSLEFSRSEMRLFDVDNDGLNEILLEVNSKLYAISGNGQIKNGFPIQLDGNIWSISPVMGKDFIAYSFIDNSDNPIRTIQYLQVINLNNGITKKNPIKICESQEGSWFNPFTYGSELVTYDINNDGNSEIIVACDIWDGPFNNKILAFDKEGNPIYGFPLYFLPYDSITNQFWPNGMNVWDIDDDGKSEFFFGTTMFDIVYMFDLNNNYGVDNVYWGTYRGNERNTGGYKLDKLCTDTDGGYSIYTKGTLTATNSSGTFTYTDSCVSPSYLKEYYCQSNQAYSTNVYCPAGCLNYYGTCKRQTDTGCYTDPKTKKKVCPGSGERVA